MSIGIRALDIAGLLERIGEPTLLAIGGFAIGMGFGAFAQQSRFCLRAATSEFAEARLGPRTAVWVVTFATAVLVTQFAMLLGLLDVSNARQLAARGSLSGAVVGGSMFGIGMILARGCASRLLVLSATGNLRALVSGLILTLVAQASLRGVLSPAREVIANLWTVDGGAARNILATIGGGAGLGVILATIWLVIGMALVRRNTVSLWIAATAAGVGVMVALGWLLTFSLSQYAFEPIAIKSVSFTGPSADTLMSLINAPTVTLGFDIGLVPGVFAGALLAAVVSREWRLEGYHGGASMVRYITGAALMGFGSMLAGGCAVGAGITGGAIFAVTAWVALAAMWSGAVATAMLDRRWTAAHARDAARMTAGDQRTA